MSIQIINKQKLLVDNIIVVSVVIMIGILAFCFHLIIIMSAVVYPIFCLLIYGFLRTHQGIFNKRISRTKKVLNLIAGALSIFFSLFILILIFSQPTIPMSYIIFFLALPILLIGFAGFLKGLIINTFSPKFRSLNMAFGVLTIITTFIAILFADASFIFYLSSLIIVLFLNGVLRSALYLSEYGLSLKSYRNIKLVFRIMESVNVITVENNQS